MQETTGNNQVKNLYSIEELKKGSVVLSRIGLTFDQAYSDNQKLDGVDEYFAIGGSFLQLQGLSLKTMGKELGDLSDEELVEFTQHFKQTFNLPNLPNVEEVIEKVVEQAAITKKFVEQSVDFGKFIASVVKPKQQEQPEEETLLS